MHSLVSKTVYCIQAYQYQAAFIGSAADRLDNVVCSVVCRWRSKLGGKRASTTAEWQIFWQRFWRKPEFAFDWSMPLAATCKAAVTDATKTTEVCSVNSYRPSKHPTSLPLPTTDFGDFFLRLNAF